MRNKFPLMLIFCISITLLCDCSKNPSISINPDVIFVNHNGGISHLEIKCDSDWVAVCNVPWVVLSKKKGKGDDSISIGIFENITSYNDFATVEFYTYNDSASLAIILEAGCGNITSNVVDSVFDACGFKYTVIQIGTQYWLGENVKCSKYDFANKISMQEFDSTWNRNHYSKIPYFVSINGNDCGMAKNYSSPIDKEQQNLLNGLLYNSLAALGGNISDITSNAPQGICPKGFHLPSTEDWDILINYVSDYESAGKILKSSYGWSCADSCHTQGLDCIPFNALPFGEVGMIGVFGIGEIARFWAFDWNKKEEYNIMMSYYTDKINLEKSSCIDLCGVRCIKDVIN